MVPLDNLLQEIRRCTVCSAHLAHGPRPVLQAAPAASIVVIGQAPGSKVNESGIPWRDQSGDRLREWMGVSEYIFYNPSRIALIPMGFCYPGAANGADLPPRPECAPLWHAQLFKRLPHIRLRILVGIHAQAAYVAKTAKLTMTETVRRFAAVGPEFFPLPHPSWRSAGWMRRNPWFESDVLPALRQQVTSVLRG